jgi:hypothetical protein
MLDLNVWNTPWPMMKDLEFGAGFQSESDADLNVAQHKKFQGAFPVNVNIFWKDLPREILKRSSGR